MEHLNRVCKDAVHSLGANKTPKALVKVAKVISTLDEVLQNFDQDNSIKESTKVISRKNGYNSQSVSKQECS